MITRFGMAPRRADLTPAEAIAHWRSTHADAAARIPGLRRYVQLHPVLEGEAFVLPYPGYDVGSLLDFDDMAAMEAGFASETYRAEVRADEASFIDPQGFSLVIGRHVVHRALEEPVVLVTMWRRHPAASDLQLHEALRGYYADTVALEGHGHERLEPVPFDLGGRRVNACEAVDLVGFRDVEQAVEWVRRGPGAQLDRSLASVVQGAARLVARPHRVV